MGDARSVKQALIQELSGIDSVLDDAAQPSSNWWWSSPLPGWVNGQLNGCLDDVLDREAIDAEHY